MNDQTTNLPVHREAMGSISAAVWLNQSESGDIFYVTTLSRTYRDPESGEWKDSNSFGQRDLLAVAHVAQRAAQKVSELVRADRRSQAENGTENETSGDNGAATNTHALETQHTR